MMNRTQINKFLPKEDIPKLVIFLLIVLSMVLGTHFFFSNLDHHTIGIVTGYSKVDGYKYANYQYSVNRNLYNDRRRYGIDRLKKPKIGERYYVSFFDLIPSISTMHLDKKPVPESIQPPEGGWVGDFDSLYIVHRKELF